MRVLVLALALFLAGCASHTHVGDCASCAGYVIVHDRVNDEAQTKQIYDEVGKAFRAASKPAPASVAPVRSDS